MEQSDFLGKVSAICIVHGGEGIGKVRATIDNIDYDPLGVREADCTYMTYSASYQPKGDSQWHTTPAYEDPEEVFTDLNEMLALQFPVKQDIQDHASKFLDAEAQGNEAFRNFYAQTLRKTG